MNRAFVYELATARFIAQREDALFLGPPGTGKGHLGLRKLLPHTAAEDLLEVVMRRYE